MASEAFKRTQRTSRGTKLLSGTTFTSSSSSLRGRPPSGSVVLALKHKLSKREYKVVLSKTYVRTILLMLRYQGKGKWGCNAESFDLAILYYDYIDSG